MSILIAAHSFQQPDLHFILIQVRGQNELPDSRDQVFMLSPDHVHTVSGVIQDLLDPADGCFIGEDLHADQLGGEDQLAVNVLPEQLQGGSPQSLSILHGIHALQLHKIAGFLNPDGLHAIFFSANAAAFKITQQLRRIQPAEDVRKKDTKNSPIHVMMLAGFYMRKPQT